MSAFLIEAGITIVLGFIYLIGLVVGLGLLYAVLRTVTLFLVGLGFGEEPASRTQVRRLEDRLDLFKKRIEYLETRNKRKKAVRGRTQTIK